MPKLTTLEQSTMDSLKVIEQRFPEAKDDDEKMYLIQNAMSIWSSLLNFMQQKTGKHVTKTVTVTTKTESGGSSDGSGKDGGS